ncbi:MAG: rhamnan synthesis F family protein [Sulfurovum sp.]|nr:rhamnan synthesis F family protein [Sulfurovum sp.]
MKPKKLAIVIHLYYTEVWQELFTYLHALESEYDLFITLPKSIDKEILDDIKADVPDAFISLLENKGRDVLPFLHLLPRLMDYQYICKLHSKKSVEINAGDAWRKLLYYDLIGSTTTVKENLHRFETEASLGIITGKNLLLNGVHFNLDNQKNLQKLASLAKISFSPDYTFPAGTMFWVRSEVLVSFASSHKR